MPWRFVSKHRNLQVWLEPPKEEYTVDGRRVQISPGILIEFQNGYFETDDEEVYKKMKELDLYGVFYEEYTSQSISELSQKQDVLTSITRARKRVITDTIETKEVVVNEVLEPGDKSGSE